MSTQAAETTVRASIVVEAPLERAFRDARMIEIVFG